MNLRYTFILLFAFAISFNVYIESGGRPGLGRITGIPYKWPNDQAQWFKAAAYHNDLSTVQTLTPKVDINAQDEFGCTALIRAAEKGYTNIVKYLLQLPKINIWTSDCWRKTAFSAAQFWLNSPHSRSIQAPIIVQLIQDKINQELAPKLIEAIRQNNIATFKSLMAQVSANFVDENGNSLLHIACQFNRPDIALELLRNAKDSRDLFIAKNNMGQVPLELMAPTCDIFKLCMDLAFATPVSGLKSADGPQASIVKSTECSRICANCAKVDTCRSSSLMLGVCGRCKKTYYCSVDCQFKHWPAHKHVCKKPE